jgi:hypothetical protein
MPVRGSIPRREARQDLLRVVAGALATLAVAIPAALAGAGLSDRDLGYLRETFGVTPKTGIVENMTPIERDKLHNLIVDAVTKDYPGTRDALVHGFLITTYERQCRDWVKDNRTPACPPATDPSVQPGKDIADRQCNSCHLFGTEDAPPFGKMAAGAALSANRVQAVLESGHRMSPMRLTQAQVDQVIAYIGSLK